MVVSLQIIDNNIEKVVLKAVIIEENFFPRWANKNEVKKILQTVYLPFTYELIDDENKNLGQ